uniref:Uncharacterized protein n=1 Tax=Salix viminalis TaxID=40686 RepID=A0A6N2M8W5_SALVM
MLVLLPEQDLWGLVTAQADAHEHKFAAVLQFVHRTMIPEPGSAMLVEFSGDPSTQALGKIRNPNFEPGFGTLSQRVFLLFIRLYFKTLDSDRHYNNN